MFWNVTYHIFLIALYLYCLARILEFIIWFGSHLVVDLQLKNKFLAYVLRIVDFFVLLFLTPTMFAIATGLFALFFMFGIK